MRVRWLGVKGRLSSGISDSDVTITSDGLADLPEVVSPDYTVLVLDPDGLSGRPEVVYVTDHAASATSATITRGEETGDGGSVARAHEAGVAWYHAATPQDYEALPTIASGTYTPTATPGTTNTDDVNPGLAFWTRIGDVVTVSGFVAVDHTTSGAATAVSLDLPVPSDLADFSDLAGTIACEDAAGSALGEDTGDLVLFQFTAPSTATRFYGYNYSYRVL